MYIQITTRCNMICGHCCFSCTRFGRDMVRDTFLEALALAEGRGENIALGGGEPTIHPLFWEYLGLSLGSGSEEIWMATNGKETKTALALAKIAERGAVAVALSVDPWHEEISPAVIKAFSLGPNGYGHRRENDLRDMRVIKDTRQVIKAGRCDWGKEGCRCPELFVKTSGKIYGCGCKTAPYFGTVSDPKVPEGWQAGECHKEQRHLEVPF